MNGTNSVRALRKRLFLLLLLSLVALTGAGLTAWQPVAGAPAQTPTPDTSNATPAFCQGIYQGDTATGVSQIDSYRCRPDWPETGPEHYYRLLLTQAQPLTLTLSHPPTGGLDLDLFLFAEGAPEQCQAADATLQSEPLTPGVYIISVDGYDGSQGPYTLQVQCNQPPFATATPTPTAPPTHTPTPTSSPTPTTQPTPTPTRARLTYYGFLPTLLNGYPPPTPEPVVVVFQQGVEGYNGTEDTYLNAWDVEANYAEADRLALRQPDVMTPLIKFDLSSLPADAHIVDARLSVWVLTQTNTNPAVAGLYRLRRPWSETQANWLQAAVDQPWALAGANGIPDDRESIARDTTTISESQRWYEWNVTWLAREWFADPNSNYGVVIKALDAPKVFYALASAEYHNAAARPKLTISYWTPASPP